MEQNERIEALEKQVVEIRTAAVSMILGMAEAVTNGPAAREGLAQGFDQAAAEHDGEARRLAELVAEALRRTNANTE
jgi:hypothetical protein